MGAPPVGPATSRRGRFLPIPALPARALKATGRFFSKSARDRKQAFKVDAGWCPSARDCSTLENRDYDAVAIGFYLSHRVTRTA